MSIERPASELKPYESLTDRGKARRLRKLALTALEQYKFDVADLTLIGVHTNTLFRVRTTHGSSYIIRICTPGWRTDIDLRSEVMWLQALERDTDIGVPQPQPARNGDFIVIAGTKNVPGARRCVVMSWLPGTLLGKRLSEENLYKMGVLFAQLHDQAAGFSPPGGFTQRKMDTIYARDEEDVLFSDLCREMFSSDSRRIIDQTRAKVNKAFEHLYADPTGLRVIHNDLWHDNIKIHHGRLHPFDFEDTIWGYPVQDIAMAVQDLMVDVKPDEFEALQCAFRKGYESRCAWPEVYEGQIDTFRAGRMLWIANYVARYEREHLREHIDWLARQFKRFLDTGVKRKQEFPG